MEFLGHSQFLGPFQDRAGQGQYPDSEHSSPKISLFATPLLCVKASVDMKKGAQCEEQKSEDLRLKDLAVSNHRGDSASPNKLSVQTNN